ncbi:Uncharacterized protein OBRU01_18806 [Operophtera brumata]|uniref:Uncharacterized protein n=1 Tax=Operophtera brumata TaxID=104452 RepID=A0A0L7KP28_OPEBR|nr:Uncharacterized protein OBRU01_18806 [Operophtera brumata]
MSIGKIGQFDIDSGNWTLYCERVELYYKANDIKDELKLPTLITLAGDLSNLSKLVVVDARVKGLLDARRVSSNSS